jgi:hypothetical protein
MLLRECMADNWKKFSRPLAPSCLRCKTNTGAAEAIVIAVDGDTTSWDELKVDSKPPMCKWTQQLSHRTDDGRTLRCCRACCKPPFVIFTRNATEFSVCSCRRVPNQSVHHTRAGGLPKAIFTWL